MTVYEYTKYNYFDSRYFSSVKIFDFLVLIVSLLQVMKGSIEYYERFHFKSITVAIIFNHPTWSASKIIILCWKLTTYIRRINFQARRYPLGIESRPNTFSREYAIPANL